MTTRQMPPELLEAIFSNLQLPPPELIGRERYEHLKRQNDAECGRTLDMQSTDYYAKLATNDDEYAARVKTLSSIARSSTALCEIATPFLYAMYPGQKIASLKKLLRTLVESPGKCELVKKVVLDPFAASLRNRWKDKVAHFGLSARFVDELQQFSRGGVQDAQVALLLFICPNIKTLDVSASADWHMGLMPPLFAELMKPRPQTLFRGDEALDGVGSWSNLELPLRKLRELSLRLCDTNYVAGTGMFDDLIRLPAIQKLTLYRFTSEADVLGRNGNLREVVLWRCTFGWESVLAALKHLPKLRALSVVFAGVTCSMGNVYPQEDTELSFRGLSEVLLEHCPLLEKLRLDTRELLSYTNSQQLNDLDLSQMHNLENVAVESQALWGEHVLPGDDEVDAPFPRLRDILPPSLEKLTVLVHHLQPNPWPEARSPQVVFHESARYAQRAPAALREVHLDLLWGYAQYGLTHERRGENGWTAEGVEDDVEVERPSPVVGSMASREERKKLWRHWSQWEPGRGWETVVLRRVG
ncbi:hypothetical protein PRZ48_007738 [Zasmidium cellare]|uniref:F-box domain-containing protein n=1 Tax=Zasmidium cellare TaxID=395010 RepID=A0ABR0ELB7_ZASCE|nr:hypothetical protein PRZ48_007738 [Zasmidium cellare]